MLSRTSGWSSRVLTGAALVALVVGTGIVRAEDWPEWMGPRRDGVWRETGILESFPAGGAPVKWRVPVGGGYSGPSVAEGRVYVTDRILKPKSKDPESPFQRGKTPATERVLCLDAKSGQEIWKQEYDCPYTVSYPAGPRTTPLVRDGQVFTLGAEGNLLCLSAEHGDITWQKDLKQEYGIKASPVWGFSSNPLLDGERLICQVGGVGSTVVAFDRKTGNEIWRALDSAEAHASGYSSPILITAGGVRQLIVWHPAAVTSLDPETGKTYWSKVMTLREGLAVATPRLSGDRLFVTGFYDGSMMLKLDSAEPKADVVWIRKGRSERNTDALHSIISTPWFAGEYIYGVCSYGQLRCLEADNGDRVWEDLRATDSKGNGQDRWANAFIIPHEDRFFFANEKGNLVIAKLSPEGYEEVSRMHLLEPTGSAMGRPVVWSHPAFANKCIYARNDKELICVSLAKE